MLLRPHHRSPPNTNNRRPRLTQSNTVTVHVSSLPQNGFFSPHSCIILISARCVLSASARSRRISASCPAPPAVSNKSFTIVTRQLWCNLPVQKRWSKLFRPLHLPQSTRPSASGVSHTDMKGHRFWRDISCPAFPASAMETDSPPAGRHRCITLFRPTHCELLFAPPAPADPGLSVCDGIRPSILFSTACNGCISCPA